MCWAEIVPLVPRSADEKTSSPHVIKTYSEKMGVPYGLDIGGITK